MDVYMMDIYIYRYRRDVDLMELFKVCIETIRFFFLFTKFNNKQVTYR